jgi:DNA-directed RNA polymerase specialized sigma24 family protein
LTPQAQVLRVELERSDGGRSRHCFVEQSECAFCVANASAAAGAACSARAGRTASWTPRPADLRRASRRCFAFHPSEFARIRLQYDYDDTAVVVHLRSPLHGATAPRTDATTADGKRVPPFDSTAWTMIAAAGAGDSAAKEQFARHYGPVIRTYLAARWRLPCAHEAVDDGTQEVFVQCFKPEGALHGVDRSGPARFRSYLHAVVRHVAERIERNNGVRRAQQEHTGFRLDDVERAEATLSRVFDRAWVGMITRSAWLLMASRMGTEVHGSDRIRILDLRFREGLASGEIAARCGFAAAFVYQQLRLAKRDFRAALLEVVASYHPGATAEELEARCVELIGLL